MKKFLLGSVVLLALAGTAIAADLPAKAPVYKAPALAVEPVWFVEGRAGASFGNFNNFSFLNPVGAGNLGIAGSYVPMNGTSTSSTSWTAGISVGRFFTNNIFGKVSYQYLGQQKASGFANFVPAGGANTSQELKTNVNVLLLGVGADYDITSQVFVEAVGELGVGFLSSSAVQGANIGAPDNFPSANNTTFAAGGGLGLGYHATRNVDLMLNGNYYWLGKADTGVTGNPPPAGMNTGEQLQAKLGVFALTAGVRMKF